jgi:ketosteroid isomerase-like protein
VEFLGDLEQPPNPLSWTPAGADVSASGDLGCTCGTYEFRSAGKDGKPVVENGKSTSLWKKQKDGSWQGVPDTGNASAAQ